MPSEPMTSEAIPQWCKDAATDLQLTYAISNKQRDEFAFIISRYAPAPSQVMEDGISLIAAERQRQIAKHGYTPQHDDEHNKGELLAAAAHLLADHSHNIDVQSCSWTDNEWIQELFHKHTGTIEGYAKAGALIAAEIDRLQRLTLAQPTPTGATT